MGRTVISEDGRFEWDEEKAEFNLKKHGLAFEEILSVFDDPCLLELYDDSHSTGTEDRMRGIGSLQGVLVLYACYTERCGRTRIFSVRKTRPREENLYYEWLKTVNYGTGRRD
jgi:uncharacterized DUF497 family protein